MSPSVEISQEFILAVENHMLALSCVATGIPPPTVSFIRDGVHLESSSDAGRVVTEQTQPALNSNGSYVVNRTLRINSLSRQDTGNYTCIANSTTEELMNMTLRDYDSFELIVQS